MSAETSTEILQRRAASQALMTYRCQLNRRAVTGTNEYGESTMGAWASLATNVPCLLVDQRGMGQGGGGEVRTPERESIQRSFVLRVPRLQDVTTGDTVSLITDPTGLTLYAGPLNITNVVPMKSHLILELEGLS